MASRRSRRAALATGLSLVLHVAALTGMVIGLKVVAPPPEGRAVELTLIPALKPRPEPAREPPERRDLAPPLRPHLTSPPPPEAAVATLPATPTPTPTPQADAGLSTNAGPRGLSPSLSGRMGCDDAPGFHMAPSQRQACANKLARLAQQATPLDLNISDQKKAGYERYERCRDFFRNDPIVPPSLQVTETGKPFTPADADKCPMADRF